MTGFKRFFATVMVLALAAPSYATVIEFTDFDHNGSEPIDYVITVDDETSGVFTVTVEIDDGSLNVGDILGVGFNTILTLVADDIAGVDVTQVCENASMCGGGLNFNGSGTNIYDWIVRIGNSGSSGEFFTSTVFTVDAADAVLSCETFTLFGVRAQTVGPRPEGGGGSSKDESANCRPGGNGHVDVTEPGTLALLGLGLLGLSLGRRRRA